MRLLMLLGAVALSLPGCGRQTPIAAPVPAQGRELTVDATTNTTTAASMKLIDDELTVEQRAEFAASVSALTKPWTAQLIKEATDERPADLSISSLCRPLHGLTVREVNAKAKALRESAASPKPGP